MTTEQQIGWVVVGLAVPAVLSTGYLWYVYLRARVRSVVYRDNAILATVATIAAITLAYFGMRAVLNLPRIEGTGLIVVGIALAFVLVPIYFAQRVFRIRRAARRRRNGSS